MFSEPELDTIKKQVMENTQVRFANISIKASDEFMHAVDEQRKYGEGEFIIYKKMDKNLVMSAPQDEESTHYSIGIPSKNPDDYVLYKTFPTFAKMKNWMLKNY